MSDLTKSRAMHMCLTGMVYLPDDDCPQPTGEMTITENGDYNVTDYALAHVNVPCEELPSAQGVAF